MNRLHLLRGLFALCVAGAPLRAADDPAGAKPPPVTAVTATDPSYRLSSGDTISVSIFNELELAASRIIGDAGEVRLPLIGEIILRGKTVRDAEHAIEIIYRERQLLRAPVVNLVVTAYLPREVSVLGAVRQPGAIGFPRDVTSLDIVEIITRVGGFLPISKSDSVVLTHRAADGKETVTIVDLDNVISGRRKAGRDRADVAVFPGDRIWVPERLF
jgi:polysaccharide export outer membrane protein